MMRKPTPKGIANFHLFMMVVWTFLLIPTIIWWKESILWVSIMSIYAVWISHFSAYDAAKAEQKIEDNKEE